MRTFYIQDDMQQCNSNNISSIVVTLLQQTVRNFTRINGTANCRCSAIGMLI